MATVPPLVSVKLGQEARFVLLGAPLEVQVHWLKDERRSQPCGGTSCLHCPLSKRPAFYAPALYGQIKRREAQTAEDRGQAEWDALSTPEKYEIEQEVSRTTRFSRTGSMFRRFCIIAMWHRRGEKPAPVSDEQIWTWSPAVADLTSRALEQLEGQELRGLKVAISRPGSANTAPLRVAVLGRAAFVVPPTFCVRPTLRKVWGVEEWGIEEEAPTNIVKFRKQA